MNITINLFILTTAVLVPVQFCELLIYRSSSTMVKSRDNDTNNTDQLSVCLHSAPHRVDLREVPGRGGASALSE